MNTFSVLSNLAQAGGKSYVFNAAASTPDEPATIDIFGEIHDWWGYGVREMAFNLSQLPPSKALTIRIHSPGGMVTEGLAIRNLLKSHPGPVTTLGIGFVASIASTVLLAGKKVQMAENSYLMIHRPYMVAAGESEDLRQGADLLDNMEENLLDIYAAAIQKNGKYTDKTRGQVKEWLAQETWFTAQQALDAGLIDEIAPAADFAATAPEKEAQAMMLNKYHAVPFALSSYLIQSQPTMKSEKKGLLAQLKEMIAGAEAEATPDAPVNNAAPQAEAEAQPAAPDLDAMRQALEQAGYVVTTATPDAPAHPDTEDEDEDAEVLALVRDLQTQVAALKAEKAKAAAGPSGGATKATTPQTTKQTPAQQARARAFEGFTGTVIKWARDNA